MIITISGNIGSGKSSVAELLAGKLGYRHYSVGDFMRELARVRKMDIMELTKRAESDRRIDLDLDDRQRKLGVKRDNFVIDSRLGWHFIPKSKKIFLKCKVKTAAKRIFEQHRKDEEFDSVEELVKAIKRRRRSEKKRYRELYGLDYYDLSHYDLVIDTEELSVGGVVFTILKHLGK